MSLPPGLGPMAGPDEVRRTVNWLIDYLAERDKPMEEGPVTVPGGLRLQDVVDDLMVHETKVYDKRRLSRITQLVIHHVGIERGRPVSPETIARYHVRAKNWAGIGYHYYVRKSGLVQITQRLDTVSAHCYRECNWISVGICLEGSFVDGRVPTDEQFAACRLLNWYLIQLLKLDYQNNLVIYPHLRVTRGTSCPGKGWHKWWPQIIPKAIP